MTRIRRLSIVLCLLAASLLAAAPAPAPSPELSADIADLQSRIAAARARVQAEIYELERLHGALSRDAFVAGATQQQRDQIQAMHWQIRRFSVP